MSDRTFEQQIAALCDGDQRKRLERVATDAILVMREHGMTIGQCAEVVSKALFPMNADAVRMRIKREKERTGE